MYWCMCVCVFLGFAAHTCVYVCGCVRVCLLILNMTWYKGKKPKARDAHILAKNLATFLFVLVAAAAATAALCVCLS